MRNLAIALCAALILLGEASFGAAPAYKIVVNAKNPVASLSRAKVAAYFLKKSTSWEGGGAVQPVDLAEDSPAREAFTRDVLRRSVTAVKSYWQQRVFSGRDLPPPEKASDDEVIAFVKSNEHAIGYVSASAEPAGIKVITIAE